MPLAHGLSRGLVAACPSWHVDGQCDLKDIRAAARSSTQVAPAARARRARSRQLAVDAHAANPACSAPLRSPAARAARSRCADARRARNRKVDASGDWERRRASATAVGRGRRLPDDRPPEPPAGEGRGAPPRTRSAPRGSARPTRCRRRRDQRLEPGQRPGLGDQPGDRLHRRGHRSGAGSCSRRARRAPARGTRPATTPAPRSARVAPSSIAAPAETSANTTMIAPAATGSPHETPNSSAVTITM